MTVGHLTRPTFFGASTHTNTELTTLLAQNLAPPQMQNEKSYGCGFLAAVVGVLFMAILAEACGGPFGIFLWLVVLLIVVLSVVSSRKAAKQRTEYNQKVYPVKLAAWNASWLCHRCGYVGPLTGEPPVLKLT